ncbi:hypothetical protein ACM01_15190 [Streptomyces viridochromogenes]|uniref:Uncharacterized protein n=1 Tax=Streptomyces viridochromogenes TaxID=1938 RepID=A0A0J7ZDT3_STRVR|nr:hypothetical protein [Streptomyces viridochromogenes]KMS74251.1 hypothetical protein ACM01_15190 [Streptomyces viridochromogenes]
MTRSSFSSPISRRMASVASTLLVIALPAVLLALIVGAGVPESWWPRTGQAFAADQPHSSSARQNPCDLIVGPAKEYCERGHHSNTTTSSSSAGEATDEGARAAWTLIPPAAGLAAVIVWRRWGAAGHGRR